MKLEFENLEELGFFYNKYNNSYYKSNVVINKYDIPKTIEELLDVCIAQSFAIGKENVKYSIRNILGIEE